MLAPTNAFTNRTCALALCVVLLPLAERSIALLLPQQQCPFSTLRATKRSGFAHLPWSFSGHTVNNRVKGPSKRTSLLVGEMEKDERDPTFVTQNWNVIDPPENATLQEATRIKSAREESDFDSLEANKNVSVIDTAAFEASESENGDSELNIVIVANDDEQSNDTLFAVENTQGSGQVDFQQKADEFKTRQSKNHELWAQAKAIAIPFYEYITADPKRLERASDRDKVGALFQEYFPHDNPRLEALVMLTLRQSKLIRTKRHGNNKVLVTFAQRAPGDFSPREERRDVWEGIQEMNKEEIVASEEELKQSSFDSVPLEEESSSFVEAKDTSVEAKDTSVDGLFDAAQVECALEDALRPSSKSQDEAEAEAASILEMKNMSVSAIKLGEESHGLLPPTMETLEDSPESLFGSRQDELGGESPPTMEAKSTLKENPLIYSEDEVDAQSNPAVDEKPWVGPLKTEDEPEMEIMPSIKKTEVSESAMPVVVLESKSPEDEEQPENDSPTLNLETGKKAGFFFGNIMSTVDESTVIQRIKERREERQQSETNNNNEELSLLEQLQTAKDELNESKQQFNLDTAELQVEAKRREAQLRERLNNMVVRAEIAEDLNKQTQAKMQKMMGTRFEFEVEAKEWKDRYARDSPLWTSRFERERDFRRQEQIEARERLAKTQADARETVRLAREEGRHKLEAIKMDLSYKLEQKDSQLLEKDIKLKQLQNALDASGARIAELEGQRSVRQLLGEAWVVIKERVRKRWAKRDERKTMSVN